MTGPACVAARRPWGMVLRARAPGTAVLRFQVSTEAILDSLIGGDHCPAPAPPG